MGSEKKQKVQEKLQQAEVQYIYHVSAEYWVAEEQKRHYFDGIICANHQIITGWDYNQIKKTVFDEMDCPAEEASEIQIINLSCLHEIKSE